MASFSLAVIRHLIGAVQTVSPAAAARLGLAVFSLAPPKAPRRAKEKQVFAAAQGVMARAKREILPFEGGAALAHLFPAVTPQPQRRILVTHGWGSRIDYMTALIDALTAGGAEVVALDWPGHGGASGRFLTMIEAVKAIDAAWRRYGPFDAGVGHSFGGAAQAVAAGGVLRGLPVHRPSALVTIGSPSEMRWLFTDFGKLMRLKPQTQRAMEAIVERRAGRSLDGFSAAEMLAGADLSMLIVHAEDDKEVAAHHARAYGEAVPGADLFWANGYGHRRIVSAAPVLARIVGFVAEVEKRQAA
ncbi:Alpha/beta hydrolase family protein [Rhizobium sp. RU20A]|uniref:alpha/beta hydrolase n=1 Tax=Rhizobium sp. RU20A TaxID=1907412 RepID=UPI000955AF79|nr:alpha/beta hydrolase [Rhizobium sp. RU20A]SIQ10152.1 Alpha/beta hydrolase family protein [Rhizobium sp. RU20A]